MRKWISSIVFVTSFFSMMAQEISKQDYERAASFRMARLTNKKVFNLTVNPNWNADSSGFSYITQQKNNKLFNKIDFATMQVEPLVDQELLAKQLSSLLKTTVTANDLRGVEPDPVPICLAGDEPTARDAVEIRYLAGESHQWVRPRCCHILSDRSGDSGEG